MTKYLFTLAGLYISATLSLSAKDFTLTEIASGFNRPIQVATPPNIDSHLWILEQTGKIHLIDRESGEKVSEPFLDLTGTAVQRANEQGLLGIAFPADHAESRRFYLNYTDPDGDTQIVRMKVKAANPLQADPDSMETILEIEQDFGNHNGGWIDFGPDGYLYISMGDGGSANDPKNRARDMDSLLGKMLRIDVSGETGYTIPDDNPWDDEIWMFGLRNAWRNSWDRETGDFYIADVGQNRIEEVNFVPAGEGRGADFGWRLREGSIATPTGDIGGPKPEGAIDPIFEYTHGDGPENGRSITGGFVYRGPIESIRGHYFVADYQLPRLWSFRQEDGEAEDLTHWHEKLEEKNIRMISSFGEDNEANLYLLCHNTGRVFRFDPAE